MAVQNTDNPAAPAIAAFTTLLEDFLSQAETAKLSSTVDPALCKSDFDDLSGRVFRTAADLSGQADGEAKSASDKARQFAIIETAARNIFSHLIVRLDSPLRSAPCADQN
jgi:THO complex subunit 1